MKLTVRSLRKSFGDLQVLNGINLEMESGRVYCLMGPSGSGKTTLIRVLMGLETADCGDIIWDNRVSALPATDTATSDSLSSDSAVSDSVALDSAASDSMASDSAVSDSAASLPVANDKAGKGNNPTGISPRFAAVFQEDRLCEAFTPVENVMLVTDRSLSAARVRAELSRLLPEESLSRPVSTLSGGMKRRTAICRALLTPYDVLFMDEPFTGLDEDTRQTVISYILEKNAGRMLLISTHQEEDVASLGSEVIRLSSH